MPGPILHLGATVTCAHGGSAQPTSPSTRVSLMGQPACSIAVPYAIAGCPFVSGTNPLPCVTGQWVSGAGRVFIEGAPAAIALGSSVCTPNGTPLLPSATQTRVVAS